MADTFRLSVQQRRLWLAGVAAGAPLGARAELAIEGALDEAVLWRALEGLVRRHEVLRTTFAPQPGLKVPVQVIGEAPAFLRDVRHLPSGDGAAEVEAVRREHRRAPLDIAGGPPLRATLLRAGDGRHLLLLAAPSLVADARSLGTLARELAESYSALAAGRPAPAAEEVLQYADFSEWQRELAAEEDETAAEGREFWSRFDLAAGAGFRLGCEDEPPGEGAPEAAAVPVPVDAGFLGRLEALAGAAEAGLEDVVLAGWATLLWRLGGGGDAPTAAVLDGRSHEELAGAVGPYARCLPLRAPFHGALSFREAVSRARRTAREAREWQEYCDLPALGVDDGRPVSPFGFEYDASPGAADRGPAAFRLRRREVWTEPFRLKLSWLRWGEELSTELHYDARSLREGAARRLARQLRTLLDAAAAAPDRSVARLPLLSPAERHELLVESSAARLGARPAELVPDLFARRAEAHPGSPALVADGAAVTYGELAARAGAVARRLRSLGAGPGSRVAFVARPSADTVAAVLGAFQAGVAFVPLDAEAPVERRRELLEESGARVLLARPDEPEVPGFEGLVAPLEEGEPPSPAGAPSSLAGPGDLAYVVFTSGSTGPPKGVAVEHRQLGHYVRSILQILGAAKDAAFAAVSTLAADLAYTALF
ncbi:MAG TPA: condensation domain-containing protein, partial [Thermoanaerobaculia bacterium]|nr:condensation domain-containing protein [Thermoanaerobaculia bacterium]